MARLDAREAGRLAGSMCVIEAFAQIDPTIEVEWRFRDGDALAPGDDIAYLARSMSSPIIAPHLNVGRRQPAYCTSIGHILLANLPKSQLDQYLSRIRFYQYTVHTINSKAKLRAAVDDARTSDLAYVSQQTGPNLCSLAVPVRDESGACIAGINLIVHGAVLSAAEMTSRYLSSLKQAAASLGLVLPSNAC